MVEDASEVALSGYINTHCEVSNADHTKSLSRAEEIPFLLQPLVDRANIRIHERRETQLVHSWRKRRDHRTVSRRLPPIPSKKGNLSQIRDRCRTYKTPENHVIF